MPFPVEVSSPLSPCTQGERGWGLKFYSKSVPSERACRMSQQGVFSCKDYHVGLRTCYMAMLGHFCKARESSSHA